MRICLRCCRTQSQFNECQVNQYSIQSLCLNESSSFNPAELSSAIAANPNICVKVATISRLPVEGGIYPEDCIQNIKGKNTRLAYPYSGLTAGHLSRLPNSVFAQDFNQRC